MGLEPRLGRGRNEAPPGAGAGGQAKRSTNIGRPQRARNAAPTLGSDRIVAQQHARAATSHQPSRRAAPSKHTPAPSAATSQQPSRRLPTTQ